MDKYTMDLLVLGLGFLTLIGIVALAGFSSSEGDHKPRILKNLEEWEWIDYKGRRRKITVRRNVESFE